MSRLLPLAAALLLAAAPAAAQTRGDPYERRLDQAKDQRLRGDLTASERTARVVLQADPASTRALHSLGLVQLERGQTKEGLDTLRRGADVLQKGGARYPDYSLYNTLGWALLQAGRPADGEVYLKLARANLDKLPREESRLKVLNNLGVLYLSTNRYAEAIPVLEEAERRGSARAASNLKLARDGLARSKASAQRAAAIDRIPSKGAKKK